MNYLIVQQWPNTKGNHAGMSHMCDLLVKNHPKEYRKIEIQETLKCPRRKFWITRTILSPYYKLRYINPFIKKFIKLIKNTIHEINDSDKIFLLEYHLFEAGQNFLAKYLRKKYPSVKIYALSHLTPTKLAQIGFDKKTILEWSQHIDIQLTLGTSLSKYFESIGIPSNRIKTGFHYVDDNFYNNSLANHRQALSIKAIVIGNIQRNYNLLSKIIQKTPEINWVICSGQLNLRNIIPNTQNVTIKGYINENELKKLMADSDISVNVMEDTIGSNVITTSMAMGLGIISSDVGSIHDYCSTENAIFCPNDENSFVSAINSVANNIALLQQMQKASVKASKRFNIENFHNWIKSL